MEGILLIRIKCYCYISYSYETKSKSFVIGDDFRGIETSVNRLINKIQLITHFERTGKPSWLDELLEDHKLIE